MTNPIDKLRELFTEALAWGAVYGPVIPNHQWDEMRDRMTEQFLSRVNDQKEAGGQDANPVVMSAPAFKGLDADAERCSPTSAMNDAKAFKILRHAEGHMTWNDSSDYRWAVDYLSYRVAQQPFVGVVCPECDAEYVASAQQPARGGEGLSAGARYWRERAEFWRAQAVSLGWREKRDAENGEPVSQQPAVDTVALIDKAGKESLNVTPGGTVLSREDDNELPGMWAQSDLVGGASDTAAPRADVVVNEAMAKKVLGKYTSICISEHNDDAPVELRAEAMQRALAGVLNLYKLDEAMVELAANAIAAQWVRDAGTKLSLEFAEHLASAALTAALNLQQKEA